MLTRIISGGQTGADRGGLDAAMALGIPHGGWCPKGRRAEDGVIPAIYQLTETELFGYGERTRRNIEDADGTVICGRRLTPGSGLTLKIANELRKPVFMLMPLTREHQQEFVRWLLKHSIRTLNVAGTRESKGVGMQARVRDFLILALRPLHATPTTPVADGEDA